MAKFVQSTDPYLPAYFNIGAAVGSGGGNIAEDVALVSFLMRAGAADPSIGPKTKATMMNTQITSVCTPQLIQSIREFQQYGHEQIDGKVSVAQHASGQYSGADGKGHVYDILQLNFLTKRAYRSVWPRIDQIQGCPPQVTALVQRLLIGT